MTTKELKEPITESNQEKVRRKIDNTIKSRGGQENRVELYGDYYIKRWSEALGVTVELSPEAVAKGKALADALTYTNFTDTFSARKAIDAVDPFKETKKHARDPVVLYDCRGDQFSNARYEGSV